MARLALRRRREEMGFTQEALAARLGVATNTYREWERGLAMPRAGFRHSLARALQLSMPEVARILDGEDTEPIAEGLDVPDWLGHFAALEQGAAAIATFQPFVVPALLQTRDYATVVERADSEPVTEQEVGRRVAARLARQEVLRRLPPLRLSAVIDQSVLTRIAGDGEIMYDQLMHLADMADRPHVEIRVLAPDAQVFGAAFGAFVLFTSPGGARPFMACTGDRAGHHYHERGEDVGIHIRLFDRLMAVALSPDASVDLLRTTAKERFL